MTRVDVSDVDSNLARLRAAGVVRVSIGSTGRVREVHVVASRDRRVSDVVNDVRTLYRAVFGIGLPKKRITVHRVSVVPPPRLSVVHGLDPAAVPGREPPPPPPHAVPPLPPPATYRDLFED
jgi:hypothetical protein